MSGFILFNVRETGEYANEIINKTLLFISKLVQPIELFHILFFKKHRFPHLVPDPLLYAYRKCFVLIRNFLVSDQSFLHMRRTHQLIKQFTNLDLHFYGEITTKRIGRISVGKEFLVFIFYLKPIFIAFFHLALVYSLKIHLLLLREL